MPAPALRQRLGRLDGDGVVLVEIERVDSPDAVELFERWRAANPDFWPNPRLDPW